MGDRKIPTPIDVIDVVDRALSDRTIVLEYIEDLARRPEDTPMPTLLILARTEYSEFDERALIRAACL